MAEPQIIPPVPTVNQTDNPEQIAATVKNVQSIFDKVVPEMKPVRKPAVSQEPLKEPQQTPSTPVTPSTEPSKEPEKPEPPVTEPVTKPPVEAEHKLPSFLQEALKVSDVKPPEKPAASPEEEWPEEMPVAKTSDEQKQNYKNWRAKYNALKEENRSLKSRPNGADPALTERVSFLEGQNKEMTVALSRAGIEHHQEFQAKIARPLQANWNEACRIVKETGGNPNDLAKAMALSGKAQFEALDNIFEQMPDSAKAEVNTALSNVRKLNNARLQWLADAPKTAQALHRADLERQYAFLDKQKDDMRGMFDNAVKVLREDAGVELLQKGNDPDDKWWNDQADQIVDVSRSLYLDNTDMNKMAIACLLAPMADAYRKLWRAALVRADKSEKMLRERFGAEPIVGESASRSGEPSLTEDLKRPFSEVFLREFHRQRAAGVR